MNDLISRQAVKRMLCDSCDFCTVCEEKECHVTDALNAIPTIGNMNHGKHGKWMKINDRWWKNYFCSECRAEFMVETCMLKPMWNYCPNCGARMESND